MVSFGIIGIGNMGSSYCRWLQAGEVPGGRLAAVCDINPDRLSWAKENFPDVKCFENVDDMLAGDLVDAVMVVTPHYFHPPLAIKALKAGKHVLVDKPAGVYARQIEEMNREAAAHPQQKFAMMFNQRTNPLYRRVKEIIDNGEIGQLRKVSWIITNWWRPQKYYDSSKWRATWEGEGGGVLVNQAPHQLDLLQWLCGQPTKVRGFLQYGSHRKITVEDDVTAYLEYANGANGIFVTATHNAIGTDRLDIEGNKGKIVVENSCTAVVKRMNKTEEEYNEALDFRQALALTQGKSDEQMYTEETFSFEEHWDIQHMDVMRNIVDAIENGAPLIAPGSEGIRAVQLSNGMHLSSWLDKTVSLPVDENLFYEELQKRIQEERQK